MDDAQTLNKMYNTRNNMISFHSYENQNLKLEKNQTLFLEMHT